MSARWWLVPLSFFIEQNNYYGWNYHPKSEGELIANGITMLLGVLVAIGRIGAKNGGAS